MAGVENCDKKGCPPRLESGRHPGRIPLSHWLYSSSNLIFYHLQQLFLTSIKRSDGQGIEEHLLDGEARGGTDT